MRIEITSVGLSFVDLRLKLKVTLKSNAFESYNCEECEEGRQAVVERRDTQYNTRRYARRYVSVITIACERATSLYEQNHKYTLQHTQSVFLQSVHASSDATLPLYIRQTAAGVVVVDLNQRRTD